MDIFPTRSREERPRPSYSQNMISNNFLSRILNKKTKEENNQQLEEIIDADKDTQIFQQNQLNLLNPKVFVTTCLVVSSSRIIVIKIDWVDGSRDGPSWTPSSHTYVIFLWVMGSTL